MTSKIKRFRISTIFVYFAIVCILLLFLYPLAFVIATSLKTQTSFLMNSITFVFKPTFDNFINAWSKASLGRYIFNSVFYTAVGTCLSLLLSMLIAFPIARNYVKHANLFYFIMMSAMFLPNGIIPLFQMFLKMGLYNTRTAYIISILNIGGFSTMFLTSYIRGIPKELDEAANIDGSGYFWFFFRVIVPLSKPAIASLGILTAIPIWNEITNSIIFLSDDGLFPISKGLYSFSGLYNINYPELMAALVIVSIPLVIPYMFCQKFIVSGLADGAVKM